MPSYADEPSGSGGRPGQPPPLARRARRWGRRPGWAGVLCVAAAAGLGLALTAAAHSTPGAGLGLCLLGGTVLAALMVRPGAVYLLIPLPPLAYLVVAAVGGLAGGKLAGLPRTTLAVTATQWLASGFITMSLASAVAAVVAIVRGLRARPLAHPAGTGQRLLGRGRDTPTRSAAGGTSWLRSMPSPAQTGCGGSSPRATCSAQACGAPASTASAACRSATDPGTGGRGCAPCTRVAGGSSGRGPAPRCARCPPRPRPRSPSWPPGRPATRRWPGSGGPRAGEAGPVSRETGPPARQPCPMTISTPLRCRRTNPRTSTAARGR
jgi:Domain of unknown function (DUF6542)